MRVLHITATASPGGGPEHLYQLIRNLSSSTVSSFVAAPCDYPYWDRYAQMVGTGAMLQIPHRRFTPDAFKKLRVFARNNHIDLLHSHGKGAGLYGRLASWLTGIPSVHTFHGIHLQYREPARWIYLELERFLCGLSSACITVSPGELEKVRTLKLCKDNRLHMVPNGVEVPPEVSPYEPEQEFRVLHFSRYDVAKNSEAVPLIAQALHRREVLNGIVFVMLGEGERLQRVREVVQKMGLESAFRFEGFQPHPRTYMPNAGCTLSTSRWEGLSMALLESLAEGVPVVASDVVGNHDAVDQQETGLLFPLDDAEAAAECILTLYRDMDMRRRLGLQAHDVALQRFSSSIMAQRTTEIYEGIMG